MAAFSSRSSDPPDGTTLENSSADRIFAPKGEPAVWVSGLGSSRAA